MFGEKVRVLSCLRHTNASEIPVYSLKPFFFIYLFITSILITIKPLYEQMNAFRASLNVVITLSTKYMKL